MAQRQDWLGYWHRQQHPELSIGEDSEAPFCACFVIGVIYLKPSSLALLVVLEFELAGNLFLHTC